MQEILENIRDQIENVELFKTNHPESLNLKQTYVKLKSAFERKI